MDERDIANELTRVLEAEANAILRIKKNPPVDAMVSLVRELAECRGKIITSGCGTSAIAAKKIAHSLNCINRPSAFLPPSDAVHGGLGMLSEGDIVILISKGGGTSELLNMMPVCKIKRTRLVGVSENPESAIAKESDIFLHIHAGREPCPFNMLATASTLAVIAAFDAICIALMQYMGYTKEQFRVIHPGGAVGERLAEAEARAEAGTEAVAEAGVEARAEAGTEAGAEAKAETKAK